MATWIRRIALSALLVCPLATPGATASRTQREPKAMAVIADHSYPLVHLRRLHLVRPDLIPYPVAYQIFC